MIYKFAKQATLIGAVIGAISAPVWVQAEDSNFSNEITVVKRTQIVNPKTESADDRLVDLTQEEEKVLAKQEKEKAKVLARARKVKEREERAKEKARKAEEKRLAKEKKKAAKEEAKRKKEEARRLAKEAKEQAKREKELAKQGRLPNAEPKEETSKATVGAFSEQVLVPLQEVLDALPYTYESNQWKTQYTVYVPRVSVDKDTILTQASTITEPVPLPLISLNGQQFVDMSATYPIWGLTYTRENGSTQLHAVGSQLALPPQRELVNPVAWAFDPNSTTPYSDLLHTEGTNIISPSWFVLQSDGLKVSPKVSTDYVRTYRANGYQVWPLITNQFDPSFTSRILQVGNEGLWAKYAQQLTLTALTYGFEGYNFDFENVNYSDKDRLTYFVQYLSDFLHAYHIRTSVDVTGYSDSENWSMVYDRPALAKAVDYVVLMAYDETWASSTHAGPVASYPWVEKHARQMIEEVPAQKLVLGIPFYTRIWTESGGIAKGKTLAISEALKYQEVYKEHVTWNDDLKSYTLIIPQAGLTKGRTDMTLQYAHPSGSVQKIWFEEARSLSAKLSLVNQLNLAGFAAWRKGFEDTTTLAAIHNYALYKAHKLKNTESLRMKASANSVDTH